MEVVHEPTDEMGDKREQGMDAMNKGVNYRKGKETRNPPSHI